MIYIFYKKYFDKLIAFFLLVNIALFMIKLAVSKQKCKKL